MLRNILALFAGIIVAMAMVGGLEWLSHQMFGAADGIDVASEESMRAYIATLPVGAILMIGAAWMAGAFVGSLVAGILGTLKPQYCAATVSGLILAGAITNLILIPHPLWFTITAPLAVILAGYLALLVLRRIPS